MVVCASTGEFRYQFSGAGGAALALKWQQFLDEQRSAVHAKKKEEDEAAQRKAEKAAQQEKDKIAKMEQEAADKAAKLALKQARLQMLAEEDELLDREERAEESARLEQNALADEASHFLENHSGDFSTGRIAPRVVAVS